MQDPKSVVAKCVSDFVGHVNCDDWSYFDPNHPAATSKEPVISSDDATSARATFRAGEPLNVTNIEVAATVDSAGCKVSILGVDGYAKDTGEYVPPNFIEAAHKAWRSRHRFIV